MDNELKAFEGLDEFINDVIKGVGIPGLSVAVVKGDTNLLVKRIWRKRIRERCPGRRKYTVSDCI